MADFEVSAPVVGVTGYVFGLWGEFSGDTNDSATATFAQRNTVEAAGAKIGGAVADRLQAVVAAFERATGDALTQMAANISVSAAGKP